MTATRNNTDTTKPRFIRDPEQPAHKYYCRRSVDMADWSDYEAVTTVTTDEGEWQLSVELTTGKLAAILLPALPEEDQPSDWHAARAAAAAKRKREGTKVAERRNETRHPDGAAAVAYKGCPQCKARKGDQCFKRNGTDRTPYVHAPRMARWEDAGSPR